MKQGIERDESALSLREVAKGNLEALTVGSTPDCSLEDADVKPCLLYVH
jgi:hypothetical protein